MDHSARDYLGLASSDPDVAASAGVALLSRRLSGDGVEAVLPFAVSTDETLITVSPSRHESKSVAVSVAELRARIGDMDQLVHDVLTRLYGPDGQDGLKRTSDLPLDIAETLRHDTAVTARTQNVLKRIRNGSDIALIGPSAAGKSVCASQVCAALAADGWTHSWIDLSNPYRDAVDLVIDLARKPVGTARSHLVVIDDLQSAPSAASRVASLLPELRNDCAATVQFLALAWETVGDLEELGFGSVVRVAAAADETVMAITGDVAPIASAPDLAVQIRRLSHGNALVAKLACQYVESNGHLPRLEQLAALAFDEHTHGQHLSRDALTVLYRIAALGQFEVEVKRDYAMTLSEAGYAELESARSLRRSGAFVSLGHRTSAGLIERHISREFPFVAGAGESPVRLAVNYLRTADDRQVRTVLERLDLAALRDWDDQHGTAFLARAWESLEMLVGALGSHAGRDPSWGDNLASAVFAAEGLAELEHETWAAVGHFVRGRWEVPADGALPQPVGLDTAERVDFDEIRKTMAIEDAVIPRADGAVAQAMDMDRAHRTWVMGLLMGFEGTALVPDSERVKRLRACAAAAQDPLDGSFYPSRVPWVTARVVMGLAETGATISNDEVVRKACDWLRRPAPDGPYALGTWASGTGSWNSTVMTTAMCLLALLKAGVPTTDRAVRTAHAYVMDARADWSGPGAEIDAANCLEIALRVDASWRNVSSEISQVLSWARAREPWGNAAKLASDSQDESSKAPFVASALIGIIWTTVRNELPLLLESVAGREIADGENETASPAFNSLDVQLVRLERHVQDQLARLEAATRGFNGNLGPSLQAEIGEWAGRLAVVTRLRRQLDDARAEKHATISPQLGTDIQQLAEVILPDHSPT
jgi:hypothetical protein